MPSPLTDDQEVGRLVDECVAFVADWNAGRLDAPDDDPEANSGELADRHSRYIREICARRVGLAGVEHKLRLVAECEALPDYQHALLTSVAVDLAAVRDQIVASVIGGKLTGSFTTQIADLARDWASVDPAADRELIALCARIDWLERGIQNGGGGLSLAEEKRRDRAIAPLRKAQAPLLKQVVRMRATTLAGLRAKGATLALWDGEQLTPHGHSEGYWNVRMIRSVFCDLLGAPGVTRKAGAARMRQLQTGPSARPEDVA